MCASLYDIKISCLKSFELLYCFIVCALTENEDTKKTPNDDNLAFARFCPCALFIIRVSKSRAGRLLACASYVCGVGGGGRECVVPAWSAVPVRLYTRRMN